LLELRKVSPSRFSLVTNVSLADDVRLRESIPHWLRTFGARLHELVVVVDLQPPTGRIADLHQITVDPPGLLDALKATSMLDNRIRVVRLPEPNSDNEVAARWFRRGVPDRCQAGTPIFAFIFAIDEASSDLVLRADCDMAFFDDGWVDEGLGLLGRGDAELVQPPVPGPPLEHVSTRALLVRRDRLRERALPMRAHTLDPARRLHRLLRGRPQWLAFEQMLEKEVEAGRLTHRRLGAGGYCMHMTSRADMQVAVELGVLPRVERGELPPGQVSSHDFVPAAW
jgi:hypothetical protein